VQKRRLAAPCFWRIARLSPFRTRHLSSRQSGAPDGPAAPGPRTRAGRKAGRSGQPRRRRPRRRAGATRRWRGAGRCGDRPRHPLCFGRGTQLGAWRDDRHRSGASRVPEASESSAFTPGAACWPSGERLAPPGRGLVLRRLCDRAVHTRAGDSIRRKALVRSRRSSLLLLGESASDELLAAIEIRTPAFLRSTRPRRCCGTWCRSQCRRAGFDACFHAQAQADRWLRAPCAPLSRGPVPGSARSLGGGRRSRARTAGQSRL
jgi:hypothetical protein